MRGSSAFKLPQLLGAQTGGAHSAPPELPFGETNVRARASSGEGDRAVGGEKSRRFKRGNEVLHVVVARHGEPLTCNPHMITLKNEFVNGAHERCLLDAIEKDVRLKLNAPTHVAWLAVSS